MAYTIISESYGPRKPRIICTADSLDDLANLDCAEGSEATVGGTKYVLDRVNGWVEPGGGGGSAPFIVTLTPTAQDFSGTMDKTVGEITEAYEAGMEIWANISAQGKNLYVPLKMASTDGTNQYPSFDFCVYDLINNLMILAFTAYTSDGAKQTYSTAVYSLTPMS